MRRSFLIGLPVIVLIGLAWIFFMSHINTRRAELAVEVSGSLDEVSFYEAADPDHPVLSIPTNGRDITRVISLPVTTKYSLWKQSPPAQYYFVSKKEGELYRSAIICCQTGLRSALDKTILEISGMGDWQQSHQ